MTALRQPRTAGGAEKSRGALSLRASLLLSLLAFRGCHPNRPTPRFATASMRRCLSFLAGHVSDTVTCRARHTEADVGTLTDLEDGHDLGMVKLSRRTIQRDGHLRPWRARTPSSQNPGKSTEPDRSWAAPHDGEIGHPLLGHRFTPGACFSPSHMGRPGTREESHHGIPVADLHQVGRPG